MLYYLMLICEGQKPLKKGYAKEHSAYISYNSKGKKKSLCKKQREIFIRR